MNKHDCSIYNFISIFLCSFYYKLKCYLTLSKIVNSKAKTIYFSIAFKLENNFLIANCVTGSQIKHDAEMRTLKLAADRCLESIN